MNAIFSKRALFVVGCLMAGHAVLGATFWALLTVPESNAWMLALSGVLAIALLVIAGWTEVTGTLAWLPGVRARETVRRSLTALPVFLLAVVVFAAIWWVTGWAQDAVARHAGEMDAWLMARFGWTRTAWLHRAIAMILFTVRYIIGTSLAVALLAFCARLGSAEIVRGRWVRAALARRQLAIVGISMIALIALPLRAAFWRPDGLPANQWELVFVGAKLLLIFTLANVGWAIVLRAGAERVAEAHEPAAAVPDSA